MRIRRFAAPADLTAATVDLLCEYIEREEGDHYPCAIMLSGGRTPLDAYKQVAQRRVAASAMLHVLFSDERMVPPDSPESNYGNATPMIQAVGISPRRIMRVHTEQPLEQAAEHYNADLEDFVQRGRLMLGLLGLGADGHTGSLFSENDIVRSRDRWAIAVPRNPGPDRVSVTPKLLQQADLIVFLVAGKDKLHVVDTLVHSSESAVAGLAVKQAVHVELWVAT